MSPLLLFMKKAVRSIFLMCLLSMTQAVWANCYEKAGAYYSVNPLLLKAIASVESNENPSATNVNRQFKQFNEDIGIMQINSIWLPQLAKFGISRQSLFDQCLNIHVGAWILAQQIQTYGNTWTAVGAYHSRTTERNQWYAQKVVHRLQTWGKI